MKALALAFLALALAGCAHTSNFTSAEELKQLAHAPATGKVFEPAVDVARFELKGPFDAATHETATPWGKLLAETSATAHFEADGALGCAARELARFQLEHGGAASRALTAFVLGRCGATLERASLRTSDGGAPDTLTDQQLFDGWQADLKKMVSTLELGELAGLAIARANGKAQIVLVHQKPLAKLAPSSWAVDASGQVAVEGVLEFHADRVETLVNQGPLGWAECTRDALVAAPKFRFVCKTLPADALAWVSVGAWEPGRMLGREVARLMVFPSGKPVTAYVKPESARPAPATAEALLDRLNEVRAGAGLPKLQPAPAQSATTATLVAPFFANHGPIADKIALGLMAGWDVGGLVSEGNFLAGWSPEADAGALLTDILDSPGGRRNLLDAKATLFAAGLLQEGSAVVALVCTYGVLAPIDPTEGQKVLLASLNAARAKAQKGPAQWVVNPGDFYVRGARELLANEETPASITEAFMTDTVNLTRRPVTGAWQTVESLDKVQWSEELLSAATPQVLFFVGLQKAQGEPWARYVVVTVLLHGGPGGTQA